MPQPPPKLCSISGCSGLCLYGSKRGGYNLGLCPDHFRLHQRALLKPRRDRFYARQRARKLYLYLQSMVPRDLPDYPRREPLPAHLIPLADRLLAESLARTPARSPGAYQHRVVMSRIWARWGGTKEYFHRCINVGQIHRAAVRRWLRLGNYDHALFQSLLDNAQNKS